MTTKNYQIKIKGKVQGIGFRFYAKEKADELGIKGFVHNEPDGLVYIEAEGEQSALQKFVEWCNQGPSSANVFALQVKEQPLVGFGDFLIK